MLEQVGRVAGVFKVFRGVGPEVSIRIVQFFVEVALNEGATITELASQLGLPQSSASRAIMALGAAHWIDGKPGLGLVQAEDTGRSKRLYLTPKGRAVIVGMVAALEGKRPQKLALFLRLNGGIV
jgi:DNA-binding MarR family transcriptional regulator